MKTNNASAEVSPQSPKPRQRRTRQVSSSRFLSSSPLSLTATSLEFGFASSSEGLSPTSSKPGSNPAYTRTHRSFEDPPFPLGKLWPSSSPQAKASVKRNLGTLADHIGNDRIREYLDRKSDEKSAKTSSSFSQSKQRSCRVFARFENDTNNSSKEHNRPTIGGSMRYTGKFGFSGESSSSSVKKPDSNDSGNVSGRLSVDDNALYRKSLYSWRNSDSFTNSLDSESDYSDACSGTVFSSPATGGTLSSRKLGMEVHSKYTSDRMSRMARQGASDSNIPNPLSSDDSSLLKKLTLKKAIESANSLIGYKSSKSQWALSPGRSKSPPMYVESMEKPMKFSSLKLLASPSKVKGLEKFLSMGFDLFKTMKSSLNSSPMGFGNSQAVHQLRLLVNRLMQWRYANARAQAVNGNISHQTEEDIQSASIALRHASDLTASIKSMLTSFSPSVDKTAPLLSELAEVVAEEKQLLEEFYDHFQTVSVLELQERSVKCSLNQLECWQRKYQLQQLLPKTTS